MTKEQVRVGARTFEANNLDKVMFPGAGLTQRDLWDYYHRIADTMLPHIQDRPLTLQRFPNGIDAGGFYQKEAPDYFPDWIRRVTIKVKEDGREQLQLVCDDAATLAYLVDQGCITLHTWLSRADRLRYPDKLIFDLDPPDHAFGPIRAAAHLLRELLDDVGLVPFVMTTGSRGLHVVAPLDRGADFDTARAFARDLADLLAEREPDRLTTAMRKSERGDRLFLDYLRNSYGQNSVAPYSVRAKPGAPIATPLGWDELDDTDFNSQTYTVDNIFRRLGQKADPWKGMLRHARSLERPRERLDAMLSSH